MKLDVEPEKESKWLHSGILSQVGILCATSYGSGNFGILRPDEYVPSISQS